MALVDWQTGVSDALRDNQAEVTDQQRDDAIKRAVLVYSGLRARSLVEDVTATADGKELPLPTGWASEFSAIVSIEHPVGSEPPDWLDDLDYYLYRSPSSVVVRLSSATKAGEVFRFTFTARHQVDATTDSVPEQDRQAGIALAVADCFDQLESVYGRTTSPSLAGDSIDQGAKARRMNTLAEKYRVEAYRLLGVPRDRQRTASRTFVWPDTPSGQF